jgi:hypothetical protein
MLCGCAGEGDARLGPVDYEHDVERSPVPGAEPQAVVPAVRGRHLDEAKLALFDAGSGRRQWWKPCPATGSDLPTDDWVVVEQLPPEGAYVPTRTVPTVRVEPAP